MLAYILRRLLFGLFIVWGVYTLTFLAVNLAPGDPFTAKENAKVSEADLQRLRAKWGYDRPVWQRYLLQVRRMFWADPEVLPYEGGGVAIEVFGSSGGPRVRARVQTPPEEVVLKPTRDALLDYGATEVRLRRGAGGAYAPQPIRRGTYRFGVRKLTIADADEEIVSGGVRIRYSSGRVSAEPVLAAPPRGIILAPETGGARSVLLPANGDGGYGPAPVGPGRYRYEDADILVPEEPLGRGGPTFDLGTSILHNEPVVRFLAPKLVATLILATSAILLEFLIGVSLGVFSAIRKNSGLDSAVTVGALFVYSMPGFWLAVMLQLLFAVELKWLPAEGMHGVGAGGFWDLAEHLVLPSIVLGVAGAAGLARYQRSAVLEILGEDYVRTARAKGVGERRVIWKHVMRNALLPTITLFGLTLPFLVSGAVIAEQIFSWPGIGRAAIEAIVGRDVFVVTGITLLATLMVVVGNVFADVMYAVVDPRVRLS